MHFKTVFDVTQQGYAAWWFPAFGLLFVCIGALFVFAPTTMNRLLPRGPKGRARTVFNWCFFIFAIAWTLLNFVITYDSYRKAMMALRDGQYAIVEGYVSDKGHRFSYSDYVASAGFNNTASHGGPIREGLYVRVTYTNGVILRLEVAQ